MKTSIITNGPVTPTEIEELRALVGWERCEGTYEQILKRHDAYYVARTEDGLLVGYASVLSDGIADAYLIDLMVHPQHQRAGLGSSLVKRAEEDVRKRGIQCLQVTFDRSLASFYAACGFHIFGGGVIDFRNMAWGEGEPAATGANDQMESH
ncbi:MAG: GNAT family N-acetyltransferase [Lentisphaerae bacterium]|nr:GNAT family N-acetyltransferase [Lentisphaerota bacterium]